MTRDEGLHRAVIAEPDDDGPRLVYADWFDEHGQAERAEFIRTQVALARSPAGDPRRPEWRRREAELLGRFGWAWAEHLGSQVSAWEYRRGFIERAEMSLETSRDEIVSVLREEPVRHLRDTGQFCDLSGVVDALPDLAGLTGLEFWGLYAFEDDLLRTILASPHLAGLRTLILHHDRNGNIADEDVIAEGLRSPYRSRLEELAVNVDGVWRGPAGEVLRSMADSPYLRNLRKLDLSHAGDPGNGPGMTAETARMLGASPNLARLEELDLGRTSFPTEAWDEVVRWPCLPRLRWLRLHYARVVNPPSTLTVAEIANLPEYHGAFDSLAAEVDWESVFFNPHHGPGTWTGQSWEGLRQAHLFGAWPFVRDGDLAGLEAAFRADCARHAGEETAYAIEAVPTGHYETELVPALRTALAAADGSGAAALYLLHWGGLTEAARFHATREAEPEPFVPHRGGSVSNTLAESPGPAFHEADTVRDRLADASLLDPSSARHYLVARLTAAVCRCATAVRPRLPVYLDAGGALLRVWRPASRISDAS